MAGKSKLRTYYTITCNTVSKVVGYKLIFLEGLKFGFFGNPLFLCNLKKFVVFFCSRPKKEKNYAVFNQISLLC